MAESASHRIRPVGGHILTTGSDLVQAPNASTGSMYLSGLDGLAAKCIALVCSLN